jgi:hypothetical protein
MPLFLWWKRNGDNKMEHMNSRQTVREALRGVGHDVQSEVTAKSQWVMGNTVSSLVEEVAATPIGGPTRDILLLFKMTRLFDILEQQKVLKQDEVDELDEYLLQLNRVYTKRPEPK